MQGEDQRDKGKLIDIIVMETSLVDETVSKLALAMTNAALGYEYAMIALEREEEFGVQTEIIHSQLDSFKKVYFTNRARLSQLDGGKLVEIEARLYRQRQQYFCNSNTRH